MKTFKNKITELKIKFNLKPFKVIKLKTGLFVGHFNNGQIKVLNYDS